MMVAAVTARPPSHAAASGASAGWLWPLIGTAASIAFASAFSLTLRILRGLSASRTAALHPPQAILVLGGNRYRERLAGRFAALLAAPHQPDGTLDSLPPAHAAASGKLPVFISSGNDDAADVMMREGVAAGRLRVDNHALDTVTNFTEMLRTFQRLKITHVLVVTSDYHMPRAAMMAKIVLQTHGIAFSTVTLPSRPETCKKGGASETMVHVSSPNRIMIHHVFLACVLVLASPQFAAARTTASAVAMGDVAEETKRAALTVPRHVSAEPVATAPGQAPEFSLMRSDVAANASFAYAAILYMGTPRDYEYYVATRVMLQTVRRTGTVADLVVLASEDVPATWTNTLKKEGVRVVRVSNIPNPYRGSAAFNPRFPFALNKLLAWRLREYKRVVLLDADNLVMKNVDELFQCGSMCAVFIDPCTFHTGLIVLKPSVKVFKDMMQQLRSLPSHDAADQGFLNRYFPTLLASPLFVPPEDGSSLKGQFRLPMGYQMDAIFYNLKFKWEVPCSDNKIITFPGIAHLKPWFWWSYPLLALSLHWHSWRLATIGYSSHLPACLSAGVFWLVVLALSHVISRAAADPSSILYRLTRWFKALVGATAAIFWLLQYLVVALIVLGLPVYSALVFKLCVMHLLAFGAGAVLLVQVQALQFGFLTGAGLAPRPTSSSGGRSLLD
ncbi:unnamed protein product [Closterium sp. Yama58-4]|nr:unnamed protein product [Closterium sp. Yama58-4]